MEGGRKREAIEQYSGYKSPNQRAEIGLADDADPSDGALYHFGVSRSLLGSNLSRETRPRSFCSSEMSCNSKRNPNQEERARKT